MTQTGICITADDHMEYMHLLETEIYRLGGVYRGLAETIKSIEQPNRMTPYRGSLTLQELKDLQHSVMLRQHDYYRKWYAQNKQRQEAGLDYKIKLDVHLVGVVRNNDVLESR